MTFAYDITGPIGTRATLGVVVLQADETVEHDLRRLLPVDGVTLYVSRVPSGLSVTGDSLLAMQDHLTAAAALFPAQLRFDAVGYACTSGTSVIGPGRIADLVRAGCRTAAVTEPVSALIAACAALGVTRLTLLSPYVPEVSDALRTVLAANGISTPVFGSFDEAVEARVARIAPQSVIDAAVALAAEGEAEALFLSCTNLRTLDVIEEVERRTGLPVLSSNLVLGWDLARRGGVGLAMPVGALGRV